MTSPAPKPMHCRAEAFAAVAEALPRLHTTAGLTRAAAALALHEHPDADLPGVDDQLAAMVGDIADRLQSPNPRAMLAHAHHVLFDELRFAGEIQDYHHPRNSYLHYVIDSRRGLPITLTLIYKAVLEQLGFRVDGINAPGHFLAAVRMADAPDTPRRLLFIDPFHAGRALSRDEAFDLIGHVTGQAVPRDDALLTRATHPVWLLRMIQNLAGSFQRLERPDDHAAMVELRSLVQQHSGL